MKYLKRLTKYNIIVIVSAIILLVLPTVITLSVMKKSAEVDEKSDKLIYDTQKIEENKAEVADETVNSEEAPFSEELAAAEAEAELEMDTSASNSLTTKHSDEDASEDDATEEDASEADATATDADVLVPGKPNGKKVYLTFDDGPTSHTEEILDILDEYDVKATFFVIQNEDYKTELKSIVAKGHTLGLHSASHDYYKVYNSLESFEDDVRGIYDWVKDATGVEAKYYRFPGGSSSEFYGAPKDECVDYIHHKGMEYFDWNAESGDAQNAILSPEQLNYNVMSYVRENEGDSIVLMHDQETHYNTVKALPDLLETLIREGYEICPIDEDTIPVQHYIIEE